MKFLKASDEILSVTEFSARFKILIKSTVPELWIRGEISNLKTYSSGHTYFTLSDESASISIVLFKGQSQKQSVKLIEGMKILVYGEVSLYETRGTYQLIAKVIMQDGQGELSAKFEELKRKLSAEGLFDADRKKEIPIFPRIVGVITSPTGAAIRDFVSILRRRGWTGEIRIFPAKVQGSESANEICEQISEAERVGGVDLLILMRGGGSLEDLNSFNQESVARSVAGCNIPIISAVGHEIDFTLSDFASDMRAETPSAAAELISSNFIELFDRFRDSENDLINIVNNYFITRIDKMKSLKKLLAANTPMVKVRNLKIKLDEIENSIENMTLRLLREVREKFLEREKRIELLNPMNEIRSYRQRLEFCEKHLNLLDIETNLKRGFLLAMDDEGKYIKRLKEIDERPVNKEFNLRFYDGKIRVSRSL